jgi:hypothetical protein
MPHRTPRVLRFVPFADHFQFHLSDRDAEDGIVDGSTWSAPEEWRIGVEQHAIAVATARLDEVPVVLEIRDHPPAGATFEGLDHVVEADMELPSGWLAVTGGEARTDVESTAVPAGRHRVRIAYAPAEASPQQLAEGDPGAFIEYLVTMWPVNTASDVRVLKQGRSPWAYL